MNIDDKIKSEEGFEPCPYKCTEDKLTIGYGFNLESTPMPAQVADLWLSILINDLRVQLLKHEWFVGIKHADRQAVIIDMAYQLGLAGVLKFKNMIAAIKRGDYEQAAVEMLDSKWARQTPNRANRNAQAMRTGVLV